jgi:light-regulated signal transduction histidine kinase (bacteriophytochrome)
MKPHIHFPAAPSAAAETRAARLLAGMHKVFSHDLPNQLVVLQSLLQLLEMEEMDRLSADGREYVERLSSTARKTGDMVRFLKEMGRLHTCQPRLEEIPLAALARELRAELNQLCPAQTLEYEWSWEVATIRADYRPLHQALLGLLQGRLEIASGAPSRICAGSRAVDTGVEMSFRVLPPLACTGYAARQQRLEVVLAREWLALGGAELTLHPDEVGRFTILMPC